MGEHQYSFALPTCHPVPRRRDDADRLREQLAALIEQFNAEQCPALRVEHHLDIEELRRRLRDMEGGQ